MGRGTAAAFYGGLFVLAVALVGPVERLSHETFTIHMLQHLLLGVIAPPLLLVGRPFEVVVRTRSQRIRRRAGRVFGRVLRLGRERPWLPLAALAAYALTWWTWHVPAVYGAALRSDPVHALEHATMFGAALALWAPVLRPRRLPAWAGALLLFGAAIQGGILATLLTFAPRPWYGDLGGAFSGWAGLSPLEDQQLGGSMMWVVAGMVYLLGAAVCFTRWLNREETMTERRFRTTRTGGAPGALDDAARLREVRRAR